MWANFSLYVRLYVWNTFRHESLGELFLERSLFNLYPFSEQDASL